MGNETLALSTLSSIMHSSLHNDDIAILNGQMMGKKIPITEKDAEYEIFKSFIVPARSGIYFLFRFLYKEHDVQTYLKYYQHIKDKKYHKFNQTDLVYIEMLQQIVISLQKNTSCRHIANI